MHLKFLVSFSATLLFPRRRQSHGRHIPLPILHFPSNHSWNLVSDELQTILLQYSSGKNCLFVKIFFPNFMLWIVCLAVIYVMTDFLLPTGPTVCAGRAPWRRSSRGESRRADVERRKLLWNRDLLQGYQKSEICLQTGKPFQVINDC